MNGRRAAVMMVAAFALVVSVADAGPWGAGRGHFYTKLSYGYTRSTTLAAPDGTEFKIPLLTKNEGNVYAFVGVSDRLSLLANIPLVRSTDLEDVPDELQRATGVGDLQLGMQLQLGKRGSWVCATRGIVQAPTGDVSKGDGLLPTGSGVWEGEVWLGTGRSFAQGKIYGYFEVGHQLRGGELRDGLVYASQIGWNLSPHLVLAGNLRGVEPYDKKPPRTARGSFVGVSDRVTYLAYGSSVILKFGKGWGAQIDIDSGTHTRNLATGLTYRVGASFAR